MAEAVIRVILVVSADIETGADLAARLADRRIDAPIVSTIERGCAASWTRGSRWRRFLAGRRLARQHGDPTPTFFHAIGLSVADLAVELADRWRCPYLLTVDEYPAPGTGVRLARRWCRGVLATSDELRDELIRGFGLPSRFLTVVPPGVSPAPLREEPSGRSWLPVVGTMLGADLGSGLPTFLQAARCVLDAGVAAEFVLAGMGDGSAFARRLAERLGVAEHLTIVEGNDLVRSFWPVLDAYAQPSRLPCSGRNLLTALAHGVPTVASDIGGLRGVLDGGRAGRLAPAGDADALAAAILEMITNPKAAQAVGRAGRARIVEAYSPSREADTLAARYRAMFDSTEAVVPRLRADAPTPVSASRRS